MGWVIVAIIALCVIIGWVQKFGFFRTIISIVIGIPVGGTIGGFIGITIGEALPCYGITGCMSTSIGGNLVGAGIGAIIGLSLMLRLRISRDKFSNSEKTKNAGKRKRETFTPTM